MAFDAINQIKSWCETAEQIFNKGHAGVSAAGIKSVLPSIEAALTAPSDQTAQGVTDDARETILDLENRIEYRQRLIAANFAANNFITVDIPDLQTLIRAATTPKPCNCDGLVKALGDIIKDLNYTEAHNCDVVAAGRKALAAHRAQMGGE